MTKKFFAVAALLLLAGCNEAPTEVASSTEALTSQVTCSVLDRTDTDLIVALDQPGAKRIVVQLLGKSAGQLCMIDNFSGNCPICP